MPHERRIHSTNPNPIALPTMYFSLYVQGTDAKLSAFRSAMQLVLNRFEASLDIQVRDIDQNTTAAEQPEQEPEPMKKTTKTKTTTNKKTRIISRSPNLDTNL